MALGEEIHGLITELEDKLRQVGKDLKTWLREEIDKLTGNSTPPAPPAG